MANCSESTSQQFTEVNALNSKLMLDEQLDNRREVLARARAWESLALMTANNAALISHALNANMVVSAQTGDTQGQQTNSAIRTGTGDNIAAGSTPANRVVDETGAVAAGAVNSATAQATLNNVSAQLGELVSQVASLAALMAQVVQNAKQGAQN